MTSDNAASMEPKRRGRGSGLVKARMVNAYLTEDQVALANSVATANGITRHAVFVLAIRSGLGFLAHMSPAELWAMLPQHVKARMRREGFEPADRHTLRERLKRKRLAEALRVKEG